MIARNPRNFGGVYGLGAESYRHVTYGARNSQCEAGAKARPAIRLRWAVR